MKDALIFILSSIVAKPEEIQVEESTEEGITNFIIHAAKEDIGKIIGKEGKIIRAIRNVMKIPAIKQNLRIHVSIADTE